MKNIASTRYSMTIHFHKHDIPADLKHDGDIAIDTETMGLNPNRDPLCVVQFSFGDDEAHIVQMNRDNYDAPNLKKLLAETKGTALFHFARFDVAIIKKYLGVTFDDIYCTRSASKLVRTYTCLLYTSPSPRDLSTSRMPSSA